jgi:translation initiation factor 2 gamma subunit (eIF-2gamma)
MTAEKKQELVDTCRRSLAQNEVTLRGLHSSLKANKEVQNFIHQDLSEYSEIIDISDELVESIEKLIPEVEDLLISCAENLRKAEALEVDE